MKSKIHEYQKNNFETMSKKYLILFVLLSSTFAFSQSWQWIKRGGSNGDPQSGNPSSETIAVIDTDSQGNVYMVAPVSDYNIDVNGNPKTGYGYQDNVISSFSCDGTYRWSTVVGGHIDDYIHDLKVDSNGDVYVVMFISLPDNQFQELFHFDATTVLPFSNTYENGKRLYIVKYSGTTGSVIWIQSPQVEGLFFNDYFQGSLTNIDIDSENNLYILASLNPGTYCNGALVNSTTGNRKYILKYNNNGVFISASLPSEMTFIGNPFYKRNPINGKFYITCVFLNINGVSYPESTPARSLVCLSSNGAFEWKKMLQNPTTNNTDIRNIKIDNDGNLYISGFVNHNGTFDSYTISATTSLDYPFLLKLNPNGSVIWGTNATISVPASNSITYVGINNNEVVVSPYFHGITWGGSLPNNGSNGGQDVSLWRFNKTTGAFIGNTRLTSTNGLTESVTAITSDIHNNFYVGGNFGGDITGNGTTLNSVGGGSDFFVAKYGSNDCSLSTDEPSNLEKATLFPNPAQESVYINTEESVSYAVFNVVGKKVLSGTINNAQTPIVVSHLANGTYIMQIKSTDGKVKQSKFVKM